MMRHDDRCSFIIGNHHLIHHQYPNYNYGEYWIDYLCKTNKLTFA
jgi:sterol desaturase/sphingolipid hydroxylase (fatty acid hydroxylase superfamily)